MAAPIRDLIEKAAASLQPAGGQAFALTPAGAIPKPAVLYNNYTPTWTASGTAPAIGNATVAARYALVGKLIHVYGSITFGSTSTFGTGTYAFALPGTASAAAAQAFLGGSALVYDSSANSLGTVLADFNNSTTIKVVYGATYLGTNSTVGQTTPWTWAVGDIIAWNILYESA